ncbi:hypothetical protein SAMN05660841_04276 [Sphingobacterium nematocida]|uniref:Uncharacterized protein n=2 Tax=Sphingobacterium TaxID=28453 RepID=U2HUM9_9SPHI|nr:MULTISPECIES: hypothetical protein [Sphingobacterium]ERJ58985.1 hypothetical protein M472_09405 [Sphingobacterium paucimobilis HER1398]SKC10695.1 hypothetical protein SAMN05660841_04276 [Sphingobacterium nematocida]
MALQWFHYTGSNPADPADYTKYGSSAPSDCSAPRQQLCAIQADDDGGGNEPVLDNAILLEMVQALQNQSNTTNVFLKPR